MCENVECEMYPMYGCAPHECYWRKDGGFEKNALGTSTVLPVSQWPDNFYLEVEQGKAIEEQLKWGACGVFFCPTCKQGSQSADDDPNLWHPKNIKEAA